MKPCSPAVVLRPSWTFLRGWLPLALVVGLVVIATGWTTNVRAETSAGAGATEITSLPRVITSPGVYFLNQNFSLGTNADAITVQADGVTIDLNGHTISGAAIGNGVTCAAVSCNGPSRLTVRNGTIRGYAYGIFIGSPGGSASPSYAHLVENVRFLDCTYTAVALAANGSLIRHCQAYRIGGSSQPFLPRGIGFLINYYNNGVQDCDIGSLVTSTAYPTIGIHAYAGGTEMLIDNRIGGAQCGVYLDAQTTGKYRDNLCAASVTTPYTGGTDAGNN